MEWKNGRYNGWLNDYVNSVNNGWVKNGWANSKRNQVRSTLDGPRDRPIGAALYDSVKGSILGAMHIILTQWKAYLMAHGKGKQIVISWLKQKVQWIAQVWAQCEAQNMAPWKGQGMAQRLTKIESPINGALDGALNGSMDGSHQACTWAQFVGGVSSNVR